MKKDLFSNIPLVQIQEIKLDILIKNKVQLFVQRDDLLHKEVSGNKWRKLKYVLTHFDGLKYKGIVSFGGPFSNHLLATSEACRLLDIPFVAYIRGHQPEIYNSTIKKLLDNGNCIYWCSNDDFRELRNAGWSNPNPELFSDHLIIPEGGSGESALVSCSEISEYWTDSYNYACCSIGTGTTFSGMMNGLSDDIKGVGFVMLKDRGYLSNEIETMINSNQNYCLNRDYHFNGFGKVNDELIQFMNEFYDKTGIKLDPVYTGKLLFGIIDMVKNNYFEEGAKIIAIHTGGLQGITGMNEKLKRKNKPYLKYEY